MAEDVRYDRDIYSWLTSLELTEYYFMFKAVGLERMRDVLYLEMADLQRFGIDEPTHLRAMMIGIQHVSVPERMLLKARTSAVWQSGRLITKVYEFVDLRRLMNSMRVCKKFRDSLSAGMRRLAAIDPQASGIPLDRCLPRFTSLTELKGRRLGVQGATDMATAFRAMTVPETSGVKLLTLDLDGAKMGDNGMSQMTAALSMGACTQLLDLNLRDNGMHLRGAIHIHDFLVYKRHRALTRLDLSGNSFGNDGIQRLASALAKGVTPNLLHLDLASTHLGDQGMAYLCDALATRCIPKLESLDLRWNPTMGDRAGNRLLVVFAYDGLPRLEELRMRGHRISPRICDKLLAAADARFHISV